VRRLASGIGGAGPARPRDAGSESTPGRGGMSLARLENMSPTISCYMTPQPWTIEVKESLAKAHQLMRDHGIRHLPVLDHGRLVGIVSRGDLHLLETIGEFPLESVEVSEAMTEHPYVVRGETPVVDAAAIMAKRKFGCAIVVAEDGRVEGIFTTIDALGVLVDVLRGGARTAAA
jgi:acetoin utilization protein AcuB